MSKSIVLSAAFVLMTAIILGAMAAHGLKEILSEELIETFEKGVRYQFIAGFSLLIIGLSKEKFTFRINWFVRLTWIGMILFSGCIYGYCFHVQAAFLKPLVYLVPLGGTSLILAWAFLIGQLIRFQK